MSETYGLVTRPRGARIPTQDRKANAVRMRRYRQRTAAGVIVVPVEVGPQVVNYLIRIKRLNEYERRDRAKIGRLVSNFLRRYVERANARAS